MDANTEQTTNPPRVGISSCLLGEAVRYDGGDKRDEFLVDTLGRFVQWVPVCPEVEVGLGTPREPIELRYQNDELRLAGTQSGTDLTERMRAFAEQRVAASDHEGLCGYVLKSKSPSCGLNVAVATSDESSEQDARAGLFAEALMRRFPHLSVVEESQLAEPALCDHWLQRVFACQALRTLWDSEWVLRDLVEFHTVYKFLLLAHDEVRYRQLGRIVAAAKSIDRAELERRYEAEFMSALSEPASEGRNANVFQHMLGHFSHNLDYEARQNLIGRIYNYRCGGESFAELRATFLEHAQRLDIPYLKQQAFLQPGPLEQLSNRESTSTEGTGEHRSDA